MTKILSIDTTTSNDYEYVCIESISSSTGVADANTIIETDANGLIDPSFLPSSVVNGYDWKESVRVASKVDVTLSAPGATIDGVTMVAGDRVLLSGQTAGDENGIYIWNGAAVAMTRAPDADVDAEVTSGNRVYVSEGNCAEQVATLVTNDPIVLDTTALVYEYQSTESVTGGDGVDITAGVVSLDLVSDGGLEFVSGEVQVKFADTSVAADMDGTNGLHAVSAEDLSSNGANQGANILGFDPTNCSLFTATNVQAAMDELCAVVEAGPVGKTATVDGSGVTKGDALYFSANDTVSKYPNNTNDQVIGFAASTVAAAGTVTILDTGLLTGVISGATAGDKYYWDGTNHTNTVPSASGTRVYRTGVAANATDICIGLEFIKKNA